MIHKKRKKSAAKKIYELQMFNDKIAGEKNNRAINSNNTDSHINQRTQQPSDNNKYIGKMERDSHCWMKSVTQWFLISMTYTIRAHTPTLHTSQSIKSKYMHVLWNEQTNTDKSIHIANAIVLIQLWKRERERQSEKDRTTVLHFHVYIFYYCFPFSCILCPCFRSVSNHSSICLYNIYIYSSIWHSITITSD